MSSTGPNSPSSAFNGIDVGSHSWDQSTFSNSFSSNDQYCVLNLPLDLAFGQTGITNYLCVTNFNFNIPANSIINGVVVSVERKRSGSVVSDSNIKLIKDNIPTGNNNSIGAAWPGTDNSASYGSSSDLWGLILNSNEVNATGFGIAIASTVTSVSLPSIDQITMTVHYTEGVPNNVYLPNFGLLLGVSRQGV